MSAALTISIPERDWMPISDAPKDGTMVFLRDELGNVDIGLWCHFEWNCELGTLRNATQFAVVSIATRPDRDGKCGRCGRVRGGP